MTIGWTFNSAGAWVATTGGGVVPHAGEWRVVIPGSLSFQRTISELTTFSTSRTAKDAYEREVEEIITTKITNRLKA